MSLPQCTSGEHAYVTPYIGTGGGSGNTPQEACNAVIAWHNDNGYGPAYVVQVTPTLCKFSHSGTQAAQYDIGKVCTPEGEVPEEPPAPTTCSGACTITINLDAQQAIQQLRTEAIAQVQDPAALGLTPAIVAQAYAWGFAAVMGAFIIGWMVSAALSLVKKV